MNSTANFMSALSGYGTTRPITRPPTMIRPYPPGTAPPEDDLAMAMRAENQPGYLPGGVSGPSMAGPPTSVPGPRPGDLPLMPHMAPSKHEPMEMWPDRSPKIPSTPTQPSTPMMGDSEDEPGLGRQFLAALGQSLARAGRQGSNNGSFRVRRPRVE